MGLIWRLIETAARRYALQVAALAAEDRLNADGSDWQGPRLPCACGQPARYAGRRAKTFLTALGPVELSRAYYHCPACNAGFFPRDRSLGLEATSLSPAATRMVGTVAACRAHHDVSGGAAGLSPGTSTSVTIMAPTRQTGQSRREWPVSFS